MGDTRLTKAGIEKRLREAWDRYQQHVEAGDDMAAAGRELAEVVERIVIPPPCAPPRAEVLRDRDPLIDYGVREPGVRLNDDV